MRSLGVCCILLALAIVAPPAALRSDYEGLWGLGTLVLLGVTAQNVAGRLRLPPLTGWVLAGLVLGASLLDAAVPQRAPLLALSGHLAGLWAGLLVTLGATWPAGRRHWQLPAVVAASTVVAFAMVAGGVALIVDLPAAPILLLAALACLWGPLVTDAWGDPETRLVSLLGVGAACLILSAVLWLGFPAGGREWAARLWLGALAGALAAEALWRLGVFERRDSALLALGGASLVAAMATRSYGMPAVPVGIGAGLVLAVHGDTGRQLANLLAPARLRAVLLFCALLVASVDAVGYWPPPPGLLEILGVQVVVLVLLRGVAPRLWYPRAAGGEAPSGAGLRLLPRGLIAAEMALAAGALLPGLLPPAQAHLVRSIVLADLLLSALVIGAIVALLPRPMPAPAAPQQPAPEEEDAPAR